ncbi:MAG: hypothetical protein RMK80_09530 [Pseudobdellovibrionaceae bacterium]|nr:hypothetical protein [Pseudobdellovibrionaceae bacterium]
MSVDNVETNNASDRVEDALTYWVRQLEEWFHSSRRMLPWRISRDPYHILVSEMMAQQTTMSMVLPYFNRFVQQFPTIFDLAHADRSTVRALWAGLGYPKRAEYLHRCAQHIVCKGFPNSFEQWLELPGIGNYSAAILSSLLNGERRGVVDGNVCRIASRFLGKPFAFWTAKEHRLIQNWVDQAIGVAQIPGHFNEALMELGALVCTRSQPACSQCPIQEHCVAYREGWVEQLPISRKRPLVEDWWVKMFLIQKGNLFLVTQTPKDAPFLKNCWSFPMQYQRVFSKGDLPSWKFTHRITHHRIYVDVVLCKLEEGNHASHSDLYVNEMEEINLTSSDWLDFGTLLQKSPYSILKKAMHLAMNS